MAQTKAPPEKKTDWVTPTAVVLGVGGLSVGLYLYLRKKPVKRTFNISRPIPSPHEAALGQTVAFSCGISMTEGSALNGTAVLQVFEGSVLSGHGDPLGQVSKPLQISTGETKTVTFSYTAIGAIGRKDVAIVIYDGDTEVGRNEWDDLFYTIETGVSFALARPSALPNPASPGSTVTITCPITSNSSEVKSVTANIKIYEGSILAAHGTLLSTKTVSFSISPGQTYNAVVTDIAVAGSIDRRDIGVEVYISGQLITSDEWDDVFYVQSGATTPELYTGDYVGGVLFYSFRGFQPNATVTLTIVESGGYVTKVADSYGGGDGSIAITEPAGTYTLLATDNYGHTATDNFTIPATVDTYNISIRVINAGSVVPGADYWAASYFDPILNDWVGDSQWHGTWEWISFAGVHSGGFLGGFVWNLSSGGISGQISSPPIPLSGNFFLIFDAATGSVSYEAG